MTFPTRAPLISRSALLIGALACVCVLTATATTATATAAAIHYESENLTVLEGQLGHHEVRSVSFHPGTTGTGHIHASLKDGRHMTVLYPVSEQEKLIVLARTDAIHVTIAKAKAKAAKKPVHHKLRYIAAGILVVVIVVVAVVLLVDRRRKLSEGGGDRVAPSASAPPPPGDSG